LKGFRNLGTKLQNESQGYSLENFYSLSKDHQHVCGMLNGEHLIEKPSALKIITTRKNNKRAELPCHIESSVYEGTVYIVYLQIQVFCNPKGISSL
jgi:hypothetical protein